VWNYVIFLTVILSFTRDEKVSKLQKIYIFPLTYRIKLLRLAVISWHNRHFWELCGNFKRPRFSP